MTATQEIFVHIYHEGELLAKKHMFFAPRVGDELRLNEDTYYKVTRLVWCLDETTSYGAARLNIDTIDVS